MKKKITGKQYLHMVALVLLLCALYLVSFVLPARFGANALSDAEIKRTVITQMPFILIVSVGAAITMILRKPKRPDDD